MRAAERIKATLAAAGLSFTEFGRLVDLSRQTVYVYLKPDVHLEDFEGGIKCINMSKKIWKLCEEGHLPLKGEGDKISRLQELLKSDTLKAQP